MACWFSFSLFLKISAVTYTTCMRPRTVLFLKGISATILSLRSKLYGMRARSLARSLCMLACSRGAARRLLLSDSEAAPQSRKSRVADKKQTNKPTDTHCSFIGIDYFESDSTLAAGVRTWHCGHLNKKYVSWTSKDSKVVVLVLYCSRCRCTCLTSSLA